MIFVMDPAEFYEVIKMNEVVRWLHGDSAPSTIDAATSWNWISTSIDKSESLANEWHFCRSAEIVRNLDASMKE